MTDVPSPLGPNLKAARLATDMSQEQVARQVINSATGEHVRSMTVSRWERGVSTPGWDSLTQLARLYGREPEDFFSRVKDHDEVESA